MANTPFLNLVKPTDTDQALITDINNNSDKIDTGVSTLSEQIGNVDSGSNTTNDILTSALSVTKSTFFNGSGSSYTGTVPSTNMRYGVFHVDVRSSRKFVTAIGTGGEIAVNVYDGTSWSGWQQLAITPVVAYTDTAFSINTNTYGVAAVPSASIPTVSGRTRVMLVIGNFTSSDLSASQIPPTVVETSSGNVFILGSPSKTYTGLQLKGLFI